MEGTMAQRTVAEELVGQLAKAGVQRIYGIVGDSLNPITDAIRRSGKLQWIHVRHEESAAFAAGAEAQLSGRLVACAGSCGPGHLHLINGLYDAHRSRAPVIAVAAHILSSEIGTNYLQETHPDLLFRECSHYCELVSNPAQMPRLLQIAMQNAVSKGGVGMVVIPGDVAAMKMPSDVYSHGVVLDRPVIRPVDSKVAELANLLNAAKKVTLFCGVGCAHAHEEVLKLAETLKAPVAYTFRGKAFVECDNPYQVGMTGLLGGQAAYDAMHGCDLLLLLGTDFPWVAFMPTRPQIAQVDIRAENLGRRSRLDLGLWGDTKETITALLPQLAPKRDRSHLDAALRRFEETRKKFNTYVKHVGTDRPIHPEYVAAVLNELACADAIFAVDTGMTTVWGARYVRATKDRRILSSFSHASMANALPQAIGAQLLHPGRQVIAMCGDGGFTMLMGDVLTLLEYDLPIKIILFNNSAFDMVKLEMIVAGYPDWKTDLKNPNFAKLAEAIGMMGIRVEDPADVRPSLERVLAHPGPALVDVVTNPNALSLPPHITRKEMKGFALGMSKLFVTGRRDEVVEMIESNIRLV
jgi:pyruvate dehydrogenase (quinone)